MLIIRDRGTTPSQESWKSSSPGYSGARVDPAVPIHNNLAEQQMKRISLPRKNAQFPGSSIYHCVVHDLVKLGTQGRVIDLHAQLVSTRSCTPIR